VKYLSFIFIVLFSSFSAANKTIEEIPVNFFTLAGNQEYFDNRKIRILGRIYFSEYENKKVVYLFQSKAALDEFRISEAIKIHIPLKDFKKAQAYLHKYNVEVFAEYKKSKSVGLFGTLINVKDINRKIGT
jgi:hypothetical protein